MLQEDRPRPGERGPPAHALEEGQPQAVLELAHVEADGGLAQVERVRGPGEAPEAGDLVQRAQVGGADGHCYEYL